MAMEKAVDQLAAEGEVGVRGSRHTSHMCTTCTFLPSRLRRRCTRPCIVGGGATAYLVDRERIEAVVKARCLMVVMMGSLKAQTVARAGRSVVSGVTARALAAAVDEALANVVGSLAGDIQPWRLPECLPARAAGTHSWESRQTRLAL